MTTKQATIWILALMFTLPLLMKACGGVKRAGEKANNFGKATELLERK